MARIIYLLPSQGAIQGGHKIIIRHVEALRRLGFEAFCAQGETHTRPNWLNYDVPFVVPFPIQPDDTVVAPDDATQALRALAGSRCKVVVLSQNPYYLAAMGFEALDTFPEYRRPQFLVVSDELGGLIKRAYPGANVHLVPCFADERLFAPRGPKTLQVAYAPKKRPLESRIVQALFRKLHPQHSDVGWTAIDRMRETDVAMALSSSALFLSLSRLESVGMTTLEAMASGCICAGFTGVGGAQYATAQNGIWVQEDDCVAAADALAAIVDIVKAGSPRAEAMRQASIQTAATWSYRQFEQELEAAWTQLAPEAKSGPLSRG